ncbi:fungal-specific transcription factor domain-containing protein [Schizophyllum amplum]|uniref:Fungal-specific transcription factor domain-containing protein n=1 Tax=Schizophyllum amplum TaxID=97359 RepID=A0A550CQB6_9AGAR|nr:fungal-specific transcription factor domain-containing protein [Auriculariopsis ampla]
MAASYTPIDSSSFPDSYYPTKTLVKREEDGDLSSHLRAPSAVQDLSSPNAQQPGAAHPYVFPLQRSAHSSGHSSPAVPIIPPTLMRLNTDTHSQENSPASPFMSTPWNNAIPSPSTADGAPSNAANQPTNSHSPGEEYDDAMPLVTLRPDSALEASGASGSNEKMVRRRSSKACDQCRKSKCKCERGAQGDDCKNCLMLGVACTFLGPSRKRGPPKGYIDAIEARLHQTEALIGIMLYSAEVRMDREHGVVDRETSENKDERAASILRDMAQDPLAREILYRVDNSTYGVQGRNRQTAGPKFRPPEDEGSNDTLSALSSMHPSNEWQDRVTLMMRNTRRDTCGSSSRQAPSHIPPSDLDAYGRRSGSTSDSEDDAPNRDSRRQRRRLAQHEDGMRTATAVGDAYGRPNLHQNQHSFSQPVQTRVESYASSSNMNSPTSPAFQPSFVRRPSQSRYPVVPSQSAYAASDADEDDDTPEAVTSGLGELSLNEDEQVRYHGKASGLHLLSNQERHDRRNEGGIWRFPRARVWPPVSAHAARMTLEAADEEYRGRLPDVRAQEDLLDLYFSYVHTAFPIVHKQSFLDTFKSMTNAANHGSPGSPASDHSQSRSPFNRGPPRVPLLLLFAIFSIAARYADNAPPSSSSRGLPPSTQEMWDAGDEYLRSAKLILSGMYCASRPSTVQALLLMGYREIGIGAMAEAWTYVGMAVRMAQDLGMHRSADGWSRTRLGGKLFSEEELSERKRIWYGCVIMDKYVSAYIGRPLGISERDFDTPLPSANDPEEYEDCKPYSSLCSHERMRLQAVPGRSISCFNASATLSNILSMIVQAVYSVRSGPAPDEEVQYLEGLLDRWYIALPEHLRRDPGFANQTAPLPHVLALHMQYWCSVLLLHRPSIKHIKTKGASTLEAAAMAKSEKNYDLCASAANQITSLLTMYLDYYPINRCPTFLCYYIFTASIMHVTTLSWRSEDPQARVGLSKCMSALQMMEVTWPAAGRALELLSGAKMQAPDTERLIPLTERHKRQSDQSVDDLYRAHGQSEDYREILLRSNNGTLPFISDEAESYPHPETSQSLPAISSLPTMAFDHRWATQDPIPYPNNLPSSSGMSSSLPQMYGVSAAGNHRAPSGGDQTPGQRYTHQYFQELSDYQLSQYDNFPDQFMMPPPQPGPAQPFSSPMYGSEYNNIYNH